MKALLPLLLALPGLALAQSTANEAVNAASAAAAPAPGTAPAASNLAKPAKLLKSVPPAYPSAEQKAGHQGRVVLKIRVLKDGALGPVEIATSSSYPALDEAALAAARQWQFAPASNEAGEAIESTVQVPLSFQLEGGGGGDPKAEIQALFKQPCAKINEEVAAYRAATPDQPLRNMQTFKMTGGVLVIATMGGKSPDAWLQLNKRLPVIFDQVVIDCAAKPEAIYEDVLAEAMKKTK